MGYEFILLIIATLIGFYLAANIGANDLANAMGTSVGSGALTLKQAVILSVIGNLTGSILAGAHVTNTIRKGMIDPTLFLDSPEKLLWGMFAALTAAGIWVHLATFLGLPVSTTHSIVGAVVGFGVLAVGAGAISWGKVVTIVASWIISPFVGAIIAAAMFYFIHKKILISDSPATAAKKITPYLLFLVFVVIVLSVIFKGLKNLHLNFTIGKALLIAMPTAFVATFIARYVIDKIPVGSKCVWVRGDSEYALVETIFCHLQILTACYMAFAHGANDVANAVGPMAAIFSIVKTQSVAMKVEVPVWMLALGGIAVGGGLLAFGTRVIETVGKKITEITPTRGFCAEFGAATTILLCSRLGLPVSTTHVLVGSVIGVGIMRGLVSLDLRIIKNIIFSWFATLPFTIVLSMLIYKILVIIFT